MCSENVQIGGHYTKPIRIYLDCRLPCMCANEKPIPIVYDFAERIFWGWNNSATLPYDFEGSEELYHVIRNYALGQTNTNPRDNRLMVYVFADSWCLIASASWKAPHLLLR